MSILHTVSSLIDQAPAWLTAIAGVISASSAIAALTPTPADDRVLSRVLSVLNLLALNVGHAKRK